MKSSLFFGLMIIVLLGTEICTGQPVPDGSISKVWVADNGDGTYKNPILHADYSDPDAVRVGDDFYLTASSFNMSPGLPILHSKDLVNWELINYALRRQPPFNVFSKPQHGGGVWAPSIRYHGGEFYIFYPDPDRGIYMIKAKDPAGEWSAPLLVKEAKGWIDPCPFWDDNGNAYLVSGLAASRSGMKSGLILSKMSVDGTRMLDDGALIFDGHDKNPTVEGPKMYKRNGFYYVFAPAGGVGEGWQLVLRSKNIYGPYDQKIALAQGRTKINGPHQGAWVQTQTGEDWFLHFQDRDAYGRILHLEPMKWVDDFPVMGNNGEPVPGAKKPNVGKVFPVSTLPESDEFNSPKLGMQWQWFANPEPNFGFPTSLGFLRLYNVPLPDDLKNLWPVPNILAQKFPAPAFTATTKVTFTPRTDDEKTGLIVTGLDYSYISVRKTPKGLFISQTICKDAENGKPEIAGAETEIKSSTFYLRARVSDDSTVRFSYSEDANIFKDIGDIFTAKKGKWIGAKVGIFAVRTGKTYETGYADFDWFRVE